jgi:hypothetical protein
MLKKVFYTVLVLFQAYSFWPFYFDNELFGIDILASNILFVILLLSLILSIILGIYEIIKKHKIGYFLIGLVLLIVIHFFISVFSL